MNYFLHRISHESEISYPLLEQGYITIGWLCYANTDLLLNVKEKGEHTFDLFMKQENQNYRGRWCLLRFFRIKVGDYILIPLYNSKFSIYKVLEEVMPISSIQVTNLKNWHDQEISLSQEGLFREEGKYYDLGFAIKAEPIVENIPRSYAPVALISRMKIRQTNANIDDLKDDVGIAITSKAPVNLYEKLLEKISPEIIKNIDEFVTPHDFEKLVKWYMEKSGASAVKIPSKNEQGKENGADADVIAEFEHLKVIFYIQVKKHENNTNAYGITQVSQYKDQKEDTLSEYTYISWLISSGEFTDEVKKIGQDANVRLIDKEEFAKMLLHVGFNNIDEYKS